MLQSGRVSPTLAVVVALALVVGVLALVWAQQPGQPGQLQPPRGGRGGFGGGGPRVGGMMGPMMGMMGPMQQMMQAMAPPAIAVADGKVYVAAAGKLYRFDAKSLDLEKQTTYASTPGVPGPAPGGPGAPPPPQ
ncbi:MAG: hypothetical protein J7M26_06390 [Armatimonadetes bacterium]|nr:hypothetical protein [Armatimonadota bacterium]